MKKIKQFMISAVPLFITALMLLNIGCSYAMDMIEGAITDRASFSINVTYNNPLVTISWSKAPGFNFAGYEVYISEEKNDEYVGYDLAVSYYTQAPYNSEIPENQNQLITLNPLNNLNQPGTRQVVLNANGLLTSGSNSYGKGIYFFRLGLIKWDESDETKRIETYYNNGVDLWSDDPSGNRWQNYKIHTDLDEVSGYGMVNIQ